MRTVGMVEGLFIGSNENVGWNQEVDQSVSKSWAQTVKQLL